MVGSGHDWIYDEKLGKEVRRMAISATHAANSYLFTELSTETGEREKPDHNKEKSVSVTGNKMRRTSLERGSD